MLTFLATLQGGDLGAGGGGGVVCEISQTCVTVELFVPAAYHESGVPETLIWESLTKG